MRVILGRWIFFLLLMFAISPLQQIVYANLNSSQETIVEDSEAYFTQEERESIENEAKSLPEMYKIIILPSFHGKIEDIGQALFTYKKLPQDTILILVLTEDKQIMGMTGEALQKRGIDASFFQYEIETYFVPVINNTGLAQATIELVQGISKDIPKFIIKDKDSPKIPESPKNISFAKKEEEKKYWDDSLIVYSMIGVGGILFLSWIMFNRKIKK